MNFKYTISNNNNLVNNNYENNNLVNYSLDKNNLINKSFVNNSLQKNDNPLAIKNYTICRNNYSNYEKKNCLKNKPIMDINFKNSVNNNLFNSVSQSERISNTLKVRNRRTRIYYKNVNKKFGTLEGKGGNILKNF